MNKILFIALLAAVITATWYVVLLVMTHYKSKKQLEAEKNELENTKHLCEGEDSRGDREGVLRGSEEEDS